MKYLKKYKIFESDSISQDMVDDIRDIVIDLEDAGRIKTSIHLTSKIKKYISFYLRDHTDYDGFLFEEISYYVFRLKRYLGDNFKNCSVLFVDNLLSARTADSLTTALNFISRTNIDLNNEEELIKKLKDKPIKNLIIEIK